MKSNPSSSSWLSQNFLGDVSDSFLQRRHRIAHIVGIVAFIIHIHLVAGIPKTESPYENGTPNYQLVENRFSIEDQIPNYGSKDKWEDMELENNPSRKDYYDVRNSDEYNFQHDVDPSGPISTEPSNNSTSPRPTGCHEPGCPLPLMSDGAFSLVTMIYVSISFLFVFFAFCWNNHYPRGNSNGGKGVKGKTSCVLITSESKLDSNTGVNINKKQILNVFDYPKEKGER